MNEKLRWGILGTGNIARQFADGVGKSARRSVINAVGSRTPASAESFAKPRSIATIHGSYEALLADPGIDAVYNSLPNTLHHEWTIKALRAGKHVLCEKPIAITQTESKEMFDIARKANKVLVEAFMYRSHPLMLAVIDSVRGGEIGDLKMIRTSFCYRTVRVDENVRFKRELGGGGLMDIGCYCVSLSRLIAGEEPTDVHAAAHYHETGVDDLLVGTMKFPSGVLASFTCGMTVHADNTAYICGSEGFIEVPIPWKPPMVQAKYTVARSTPPQMDIAAARLSSSKSGAPPGPWRETRPIDANMDLYALEADAFADTVLDGKPPAVSEADTLGNMKVLDTMRQQIGLVF